MTRKFIFAKMTTDEKGQYSEGDKLLAKLCTTGYFDQRRNDNTVESLSRVE